MLQFFKQMMAQTGPLVQAFLAGNPGLQSLVRPGFLMSLRKILRALVGKSATLSTKTVDRRDFEYLIRASPHPYCLYNNQDCASGYLHMISNNFAIG